MAGGSIATSSTPIALTVSTNAAGYIVAVAGGNTNSDYYNTYFVVSPTVPNGTLGQYFQLQPVSGSGSGALTNGTYYVFYTAGSQYYYPSGGTIYSSATRIPVSMTFPSSGNPIWSYNGGTCSAYPSNTFVVAPAVPNTSQYFQLQPVSGTSTTTSTFTGTVISGSTYATFGWKPISTPSSNIRLTFKAVATTDLHIAFQYNTNWYIELPIGGWGNTQSAFRNFYSGVQQGGDLYFYPSSGKPIPDTVNPVSYTVTINAGVLTVTATTSAGATTTVLSYSNPSILNQTFTAYSFRMCSGTANWTVANDTAAGTVVTYSGTCNGYPATSTVSQADADLLAKNAWLNAKIPSGTVVTANLSAWKTISSPVVGNVKLTFTAAALMDLWIYFQATDGTYFFLALGGWTNTRAVIRSYSSAGAQIGGDIAIAGPSPIIPDTVNAVTYTLTIMNGQLTLTAVAGGVTSTRVTYTDPVLLGKTFSAYSFGTNMASIPWKYTGDAATFNTFTGTYSGYTATSTVSQADADAQALGLFSSAVVTSIGNSKTTAINSVNPVLSLISTSTMALAAGRQAFVDIASQLDTLAGQAGFTPKLPWQA